jgi:hypothetical protein
MSLQKVRKAMTWLCAVGKARLWPVSWMLGAVVLLTGLLPAAHAQETVCARVKIEIKQELTLERQAFDAEMKISNTLDAATLSDVRVVVKVTDELGTPVPVSDDPNSSSAKFFIRVSNKENISDVDGSGVVNAASTAVINWLLIPAPGSAGVSPLGKKYLVGATLTYKFGAETHTLDVSPDVITVKPLPLLTLDYFLTQDVIADDPLTAEIEATEPFTLGVRVKNNGYATAKNLKIDSAQPKIIENKQGLLIGFKLTGSFVDDMPAQNTLLINFGDIPASTSKSGRWVMETTLAGKFTEFTAKFSHADELGGSLTSILQATNAHFLIRDVLVDLLGRDHVRDFLARDGDVIRVYESDGLDTVVTDRSSVATLTAGTNAAGNASYHLVIPPTSGFVYVRLPDPFNGQKALGTITRSDAKTMLPENVWLSKTRNLELKKWEYWVNFFDVNTPGVYDAEFKAPSSAPRPPQLQFIADASTKEEQQVSFLLEASSPDGKPVTISAAPLPSGAQLIPQAADPAAPNVARAVFDWTPAKGTAGNYLITYTASDGTLSSTRSASIKVESKTPPPGPSTPTIDSPASGGQVTSLKPTLGVQTGIHPLDPTASVQFELYKDEALTQLVQSATVAKASGGAPTTWQPTNPLNDNTTYWWRARAFDGTLTYSPWVNARFFVNLYNDPPDNFNLSAPAPNAEVGELTPELSWMNAADKDGDAITYDVTVYKNAALTEVVASASGLPAGAGGSTSWRVSAALSNHVTYYWKVIAKDALGAQTPSIARPFTVNMGNTPPSAPVIVSPPVGGQSAAASVALTIQNSADGENDLITYVFELDTVDTFDSGSKRSSGQIIQGGGSQTAWTVSGLVENQRYHWRVKAQDGRAESAWVAGNFLMNAVNDAPPAPTIRNPGNGAWTASQQPSLEVNPVQDPEGDTVRYQFEVYRDAGLTSRVADGVSGNTAWIVPVALADKTTHWWRARALDASDAASGWSTPAVLYVSTGTYQDPTIQVTAPAVPVSPTVVGDRKQVTIRWEGTDPNIEPTVALYYSTSKADFSGNVIVDGLRQTAGTQSGSYTWDVTGLSPGTYYVYGAIYDARGVGKAWAAGAVVVKPDVQTGRITTSTTGPLSTTEDGGTAQFTVRLASQPSGNVTIPVSSANGREGFTTPAGLTFTPGNWNVDQTVTITGKADCMRDGNSSYQVLLGRAVSLDPQYMDVSGTPVAVNNTDSTRALLYGANNANFAICAMKIQSQRKLDATTWEYVVEASIGNTGSAVAGVTATLTLAPSGVTIAQPNLNFGALQQNEAGRSVDTITLRSKSPLSQSMFDSGAGFRWNVTTR